MTTQAAATLPRRRGRSTLALVAGFLVVVVLSLGTDQILHVLNVYPPWGQTMSDQLFMLATAYRIVYTVIGSYVTARLAPDRPMRHALILGAIGFVVSTAGAIATWNIEPSLGPRWYSLMIAAISIPCAWVGARIFEVRHPRR